MSSPLSSPKRSLQQRLDEKSIPDPKTGCRLWTRASTYRYGLINVGGRSMAAHRAAWIAKHGPIAPGLHVCHRCDTPACINPEYLFVGTQKQNMRDKAIKMRRRREATKRGADSTADILRLEIMGREIIAQILAVRPVGQASLPLPAEPPKQTLADD
jgi:hypothetical protein